MLKMFALQDHSGSAPEFWENNWVEADYERSVAFCAVDPLRPLFDRYLRSGALMLEGGCGMGNYVSFYSDRGYSVVGLDFARDTLKLLRKRRPNDMLCAGDVSALPFADGTFDLYYSGGVVEHFEDGPEKSLAEARRILKSDGVLMISVPYYSPLRRFLRPFKTNEWREVYRSVAGLDKPAGKEFFQYAYKTREFERILNDSGLKVIEKQGYAVLWGLYELPLFPRLTGNPGNSDTQPAATAAPTNKHSGVSRSLLKRLVVNEDATVPVLGLGVRTMRWAAANMMMYVCCRD